MQKEKEINSKQTGKEVESKHNFWINGLEKGSNFFHYVFKLGSGLFFVLVFLTCILFWQNYYLVNIENQILVNFALFFQSLFNLIFYLIVGGLIFKYFCYYLSIFLQSREEKVILKEGVKKFIK
jgi:hypothetical protein